MVSVKPGVVQWSTTSRVRETGESADGKDNIQVNKVEKSAIQEPLARETLDRGSKKKKNEGEK